MKLVNPTEHFPIPKLYLHQIGHARVPLTSAQTSVQFQARKASIQSHTGLELDVYRDSPAPLLPGKVQHTGLYTHTNKTAHWTWKDESQNIKAAIGQVQPFLFAWVGPLPHVSLKPDTEIYLPDFDEFQFTADNDCVTWMWAMGKVTSVTNPYAVANHGMPAVEFGIEAQLETPLIRARWSRWRYGEYKERTAIQAGSRSLMDMAEAEAEKDWWVPCSIPDQCDTQRFWPRDIYGGWDIRPMIDAWEADQVFAIYGPEQQGTPGRIMPQYVRPGPAEWSKAVINISGNTHPRARWFVAKGVPGTPIDRAEIKIDNQFGSRVYTLFGLAETEPGDGKWSPNIPAKRFYMDSVTNMVWYDLDNTPIPLDGMPWILTPTYDNLSGPPLLSQGENYIEALSGEWKIGITYQYI